MHNRLGGENSDADKIFKDLKKFTEDTFGKGGEQIVGGPIPMTMAEGPYDYPRNAKELCEEIFNKVVESYEKREIKEHVPLFMLMAENRTMQFICTEFMENGFKKDILAAVLRKMVSMENAVACVFITEAWQGDSKAPEKHGMSYQEYLNSDKFVQPSKDPNRQEIVMVTAEYKDQPSYTKFAALTRDSDNYVIAVRSIPDLPSEAISAVSGRFANILKEGLNEEDVSLQGQPEGWEDGGVGEIQEGETDGDSDRSDSGWEDFARD